MKEPDLPVYFGEWLRQRRKSLDLTQAELARRASCSLAALRKIESGERRPSKQLAACIATALEIPSTDQDQFIRVARGDLNLERLYSLPDSPQGGSRDPDGVHLADSGPRPTQAAARLHSITQPNPAQGADVCLRPANSPVRPGNPHFRHPPPPPGNLPQMLTPFLGREPELDALSQLVHNPNCRLITLAGAGGIGKTRLAIQVADAHKRLFPDGIWFVPLSPLSSSEFIIPAIADALHFHFQDLGNPFDQLIDHLQGKTALLVLDNCEHLLDGAGLFISILENCPQVKLLATSRERLNLLSEWVFEIQGLPVPTGFSLPVDQEPSALAPEDDRHSFLPDQPNPVEKYSSVALFLQSARRLRPASISLDPGDRYWVVRICQLLEGMPLGIELAAAWIGTLSYQEIAEEIEHNLDFLSANLRDVPPRHRSLRATLDHSWNLLDAEEKAVFKRLSVFRGSFDRSAAQKVCGASLALLASLRDKSLLRGSDQGRYDLHELIRQYAADRLAEDPVEEETIKDEHAREYASRLADWEKALKSSRQVEALNEVTLEIDNLRLAWQRMVTCCGLACDQNTLFTPEQFQSSIFSLSLFYELRCRYWEAISLFGQAEDTLRAARESSCGEAAGQQIDWVLGLILGHLGYQQYLMHYLQAGESLEEALHLLQDDPTRTGKARVQIMLAWVTQAQGKYELARELFEQSRAIFQQAGDEWWVTLSMSMLAMDLLALGRVQESLALLQESLSRIEDGDLYLGVHSRIGLGYAHYFLGHLSEAERLFHQALELSYQLGNKRQIGYSLRLLGQIALTSGQHSQALAYHQENVRLLDAYGESPDLATALIYLGKSLFACQEMDAARQAFLRAVRIGQTFEIFHLVYWGLVNLARMSMEEGHADQAMEAARVLERHSVESAVIRGDFARLLADLQARLTPEEIETAARRSETLTIETLIEAQT